MDLITNFLDFICKNNLINRQNKILLAVSGGVDSIVLLDLFYHIQVQFELTLSVVHINHSIRGKQADRDEVFVRNWSRLLGLPFYSLKVDVKSYSKHNKLSLEESGRKIRFDYLNELQHRLYYDKIALAHHAHDQAETIVMNLTRGSGIRGMGGIHPQRDAIIHPLLFAKKEEIIQYAHDRRLYHVEDSTNRDRTFLRNRIRWDIINPMEERIGSHIIQSISHAGTIMRETQTFVEYESRKALKKVIIGQSQNEIILDIVKFLSYFTIVQKTILIQILNDIYYPNPYVRSLEIEGILHLIQKGREGSVYHLRYDVIAVKYDKQIVIAKTYPGMKKMSVQIGQYHDFSELGMQFHAKRLKAGNTNKKTFTCDHWIEHLDYDKLSLPLALRSWKKGDWFIPLGMKGKKKLHDFFIDEKVPHYKRSSIPLFISGIDIVWIVGYRIDDRFKVTDQTQNILRVSVMYK